MGRVERRDIIGDNEKKEEKEEEEEEEEEEVTDLECIFFKCSMNCDSTGGGMGH